MTLDPVLVALVEKADGADAGRGQQLDCEDGVDLADELVADVDRRFRHRTAELEVIGYVAVAVLAATRDAAKEARLVVSRGGVGLVGGRWLRVGGAGFLWVCLWRRRVFCCRGHRSCGSVSCDQLSDSELGRIGSRWSKQRLKYSKNRMSSVRRRSSKWKCDSMMPGDQPYPESPPLSGTAGLTTYERF